jgi:hypothetical protein
VTGWRRRLLDRQHFGSRGRRLRLDNPEIANPTGVDTEVVSGIGKISFGYLTKSSLERSQLTWEGSVAGDISTAKDGPPNILGEYWKPSLQESAVERIVMRDGRNERAQQIHGRGYPSYSSGLLPASNASAVSPNIIMLTVQPRPFILTMNPSHSGLTFEQLVIVNAIRRDTSICRITNVHMCIKGRDTRQTTQR